MRCRKTGRSGEGVKWGEVDWSGIFYSFLLFPMGLFVVQWVGWLVCVKVTEYFPSAGPIGLQGVYIAMQVNWGCELDAFSEGEPGARAPGNVVPRLTGLV